MKPVFGALAVAAVSAAIGAVSARAQSSVSLALDAGIANVSGGNYYNRSILAADARIDWRVLDLGGTQVRMGVSATQYYGTTKVTVTPTCSDCSYAYSQALPSFGYLAATFGARRQLNADVSVGVEGDLGELHMWNAGTHTAAAWRADVAFALVGPVQAVVSGEILVWTTGGNTLHAYPITFGLRLN